MRLAVTTLLATIGGVGMWSVVVVLPTIQAEFGVSRADASLPFTATMLGYGVGAIVVGRLVDRFGIVLPAGAAVLALGLGYVAAGNSTSLWQFAACGLLIGFGSAATFGPLMVDISHWFVRRRGIAVALCASGNYFAGTIWPPLLQHMFASRGWRMTHIGVGVFCIAAMLPLLLALRRPAPAVPAAGAATTQRQDTLGLSPAVLQSALAVAGIACCAAMATPQAHIVAYCGDLGYGVARGAQMLSLMLGFGIVSRIASGVVADRIGGLATLLIGSALQGTALALYFAFDGLASLYLISALFGLFQGGIVPSYTIVIREYFPPDEAGARVGIVLMATVIGMAFGGWLSGAIFDLTGSYRIAFAVGVAWNLVNAAIVLWLLLRRRQAAPIAAATA
jgi:MFS family permease